MLLSLLLLAVVERLVMVVAEIFFARRTKPNKTPPVPCVSWRDERQRYLPTEMRYDMIVENNVSSTADERVKDSRDQG